MTDPTTRPTPDEILEMVRQWGNLLVRVECASQQGHDMRARRLDDEARSQYDKIALALSTYGWRPIADAPKDGRRIWTDHGCCSWFDGYWETDEGLPVSPNRFQLLPAPPKEG